MKRRNAGHETGRRTRVGSVLGNPWVIAILLMHLFFTLYTAKGHFTDSHLYYLEVESVVERGELALENGYEQTPSPALELEGTVEHRGRLFSKYPALYSLVAAPFLAVFGESGLFYLNALALLGVVLVTARLAGRALRTRSAVPISVTVLIGGTYFWYYSQAIWPHMLQTLLIMTAVWCACADRERTVGWSRRMLAAGAIVGVAIGVRLDSVFALPALGALALLGPGRLKRITSLVGGLAFPLLLLAWINAIKFGQFLPFSYGVSLGAAEKSVISADYVAVILPVFLLCLAFLVREGALEDLLPEKWQPRALGFTIVLAVASLLAVGEPIFRGAGILMADMRLLERHVVEPGMFRTGTGAVMYAGHFKKALLQSVPFLPVVLLPLLKDRAVTSDRDGMLFRWLYLIPASYLVVFCGLRWHGGMAFDMRYLIPTLPFFAILTAGALEPLFEGIELRKLVRTGWIRLSLGSLLLLFGAAVLQREIPLPTREFLFLTLPLLLSVATLALVAHHWWKERPLSYRWAGLLCIPLFWGGAVSLADYGQQNAFRGVRESVASRFAPHIPERSLVIGLQKDLLSKTEQVHFASLREEARPHLPELVEQYEERGWSVFLLHGDREAALPEIGLDERRYALDLIEPYRPEDETPDGGLFRLLPRERAR